MFERPPQKPAQEQAPQPLDHVRESNTPYVIETLKKYDELVRDTYLSGIDAKTGIWKGYVDINRKNQLLLALKSIAMAQEGSLMGMKIPESSRPAEEAAVNDSPEAVIRLLETYAAYAHTQVNPDTVEYLYRIFAAPEHAAA